MRATAILALAATVGAAPAADLVKSLPGIDSLPSPSVYSGYLPGNAGKHLHYLFYASQTGLSTDPIVLWFNGGPGCSSLEGAFQESGPLWTAPGGNTLQTNAYTWNNFSHNIFLEAPACVGFSYSDTPDGCNHNDTSTAADNLQALIAFYGEFPEYAANELWISGESYAGIYVPSLAYDITLYNAAPSTPAGSRINLKGILVGNGCLGAGENVGICGSGQYGNFLSVKQLHGHGFVSDLAMEAVYGACTDYNTSQPACNAALDKAAAQAGSNFDVYDLYSGMWGSCNYGSLKGQAPVPRRADAPTTRPIRAGSVAERILRAGGNTCTTDDDLTTYLNRADVQAALHVKPTTWTECANIGYTSDIQDERTTIYPALLAAGLKVLIFNGEADACVPFTDNQWWTSSMNYPVQTPWTAWTATDGTLGGYATVYSPPSGEFAFVTVRGAGHMVAQVQPPYAWQLANSWVTGKSLFGDSKEEL